MFADAAESAASPPGSAPPCAETARGCESLSPTPADRFLQQALGANHLDMRLVSGLFTVALGAAVVARWWRRRWRTAAGEPPEGVGE